MLNRDVNSYGLSASLKSLTEVKQRFASKLGPGHFIDKKVIAKPRRSLFKMDFLEINELVIVGFLYYQLLILLSTKLSGYVLFMSFPERSIQFSTFFNVLVSSFS